MIRFRVLLPIAFAVAVVVAALWVTGRRADPVAPRYPAARVAEVTAVVESRAKAVVDAAGAELTDWTARRSPCEGYSKFGDTDFSVWIMSAKGRLETSTDDHLEAFDRVRTMWVANGYRITRDGLFADGNRRMLLGEDPATGFRFSLLSTRTLTGIVVDLTTPCWSTAPGEKPAGRGF